MTRESGFNQDFLDILQALVDRGVEFLVVGAHAMAVHGVPRATGDLDLFVRPSRENAERLMEALREFGAPVDSHGLKQSDFEAAGTVYQIGLPPRRIDLMTEIDGIGFQVAWDSRRVLEIEGLAIAFIGKEALIENKKATGRDKDAVDVRLLGG